MELKNRQQESWLQMSSCIAFIAVELIAGI
jgi:hypothetical protein